MTIDEIAYRILSELEEAGQENVPALLNTIFPPEGDESEKILMARALEELVQRGMVRVGVKNGSDSRIVAIGRDASLSVISELRKILTFNSDKRRWIEPRDVGPPFNFRSPDVQNTDVGQTEGRRILTERGHQWWRQKS